MKKRISIMGCVLTAVALLVMLASVAHAYEEVFLVDIYNQGVHAWNWPNEASVTMSIYDSQGGTLLCEDTQTAPSGGQGFSFNLSCDVQPGNYVEVTDGTNFKSHLVANVALTEVNIADNTVAGTLDPNLTDRWVGLQVVTTGWPWTTIYNEMQAVQAAPSTGMWKIDLTGSLASPGHLIAGMYVEAMWHDVDYDSTRYGWGPTMNVHWESNFVWAWGWPPEVGVTLEVYDAPGGTLLCDDTQTAPSGGQGFDFNVGCDILPGHLVTLSETTPTFYIGTASHTVTNVSVTCASANTGILTGTAEPDTVVWVENYQGQNEQVTADEYGNWVAGPFSSHNLNKGGYAQQRDELNNGTIINWLFADEFCVFIPVEIDIKPGSDPNCIKVSKKGLTPVAVLASADLDANSIDVSTIQIDDDDVTGSGVSPVKSSTRKDVNKDGLPDLVCHFSTPDMDSANLLVDNNILYITGTLNDGTEIIGSDVINLAGGPNCF